MKLWHTGATAAWKDSRDKTGHVIAPVPEKCGGSSVGSVSFLEHMGRSTAQHPLHGSQIRRIEQVSDIAFKPTFRVPLRGTCSTCTCPDATAKLATVYHRACAELLMTLGALVKFGMQFPKLWWKCVHADGSRACNGFHFFFEQSQDNVVINFFVDRWSPCPMMCVQSFTQFLAKSVLQHERSLFQSHT